MKQKWVVIGIVLLCASAGSIVSSADKTEGSGTSVIQSNGMHCWGNLTWSEVNPGEIVTGEIWVMNSGSFDLDWMISEWPVWGIWDFGSYFPRLPPGGTWILHVNVTAPSQGNETFIGHVNVTNKDTPSDFVLLNTSLTTKGSMGYTVTERLGGILRNLNIEENTISFQMIIGLGMRIIEYDEGGIVALMVPYLFMQVHWSGEFIFEGILHPHFIKGTVRYRGK